MEKNKAMGDLSKRSLAELNELLERQNKLLSKRVFTKNLPDKGEKILKVKNLIEEEILRKSKTGSIPVLDPVMKQTATETLEWTGSVASSTEQVDTDESSDEKDPLKIFISHASVGNYKKQYRIEQPENPLIMPEDLRIDDSPIEPYATRLCVKDETVPKPARESFKPYRTVIKHKDSPDKKTLPLHDWDENTAATPPTYVHTNAQTLSLGESLDLLKVQAVKLKEIKEQHAADRLSRQIESLALAEQDAPDEVFTTADEQEEVEMAELQAEEEAEGGGVNYTIQDV